MISDEVDMYYACASSFTFRVLAARSEQCWKERRGNQTMIWHRCMENSCYVAGRYFPTFLLGFKRGGQSLVRYAERYESIEASGMRVA